MPYVQLSFSAKIFSWKTQKTLNFIEKFISQFLHGSLKENKNAITKNQQQNNRTQTK